MLSKEEVKKIAKLARIDLTEAEVEKFQKEISSVLDYVENLKEVDISGIKPMSHSIQLDNVAREDESTEASKALNDKLLSSYPETKDGHLKVKQIL